jgi:hypothetical protein
MLLTVLFFTYYILPKILGMGHPYPEEKRKLGVFTVQINKIKSAIFLIKNQIDNAGIEDFYFIDIRDSRITFKIKKETTVLTLEKDKEVSSNYFLEIKNIKKNKTKTKLQISFIQDILNEISPDFYELKAILSKKQAELKLFSDEKQKLHFSDQIKDYAISIQDFKRNNEWEQNYRKEHLLTLLKLFDNKCAKCGNMNNGIDLDHFFISKHDGGNFAMKEKSGRLINNAIPLCRSCNREKSNKNYIHFFPISNLLDILEKNNIMTNKINNKD